MSNNFHTGYSCLEDIKVALVITHNLPTVFMTGKRSKCIQDLSCSSAQGGYPINRFNFCTVHDYVNVAELFFFFLNYKPSFHGNDYESLALQGIFLFCFPTQSTA